MKLQKISYKTEKGSNKEKKVFLWSKQIFVIFEFIAPDP